MKKLFYLLIGILLLPSIVKADMAGPMIIQFSASVTNPEGVYAYIYDDNKEAYVKTDKKIPYGTIIKFDGDYDQEKEGIISIDNKYVENRNEKEYYFVNTKDLTLENEKLEIESKNLGETYEVYMLKDQEIKKGPANIYKSTGTQIKAGTKVKITELNFRDETPWYYVDYNGVKGFIDTYDGNVAFYYETKDLIITSDTEIYDFNNPKKEIKALKTNDKIRAKIGHLGQWSERMYIEYNGIKGYIKLSDVILKYSSKFITIKDVKVYTSLDDNKEIYTIPANTIFKSDYSENSEGYFTIYYDDKVKGWIETENEDEIIEINKKNKFKANKNINIYEKADKNSKVVGTLSLNTVFESEYYNSDYLVYYEKNNIKGWILKDDSTMNNTKNYFKTTKEIDIYDSLDENKKSIAKLSANTDFTSEYYSMNNVYYEKDNIKGWIIDEKNDVIAKDNDEDRIKDYITTKEINIYDSSDKKNIVSKLPVNTKFTNDYDSYNVYYFENDNVKGFIIPDKNEIIYSNNETKVELRKDIKLYEEADTTSKVITTLKSGTTFNSEYFTENNPGIIYYENGDIKGWIYYTYKDRLTDEEDDDNIILANDYKNENIKENEEIKPIEEIKQNEEKNEIKAEKPKKDYTLYICIGIAVIISITAIVTIILINKKKKTLIQN